MKSGTLCLFRTTEDINPLLGVSFIKERFREGDFINENWITIAQRQDISDRADILYTILKPNLIEKYNMDDFYKKYSSIIFSVKKINESQKLNLSWLEILQIAVIASNNKNNEEKYLIEISQELFKFYQKVIKVDDF